MVTLVTMAVFIMSTRLRQIERQRLLKHIFPEIDAGAIAFLIASNGTCSTSVPTCYENNT